MLAKCWLTGKIIVHCFWLSMFLAWTADIGVSACTLSPLQDRAHAPACRVLGLDLELVLDVPRMKLPTQVELPVCP